MSKYLEAHRKQRGAEKAAASGRNPAQMAHWNITMNGELGLQFLTGGDVDTPYAIKKEHFEIKFIDPDDDENLLTLRIPCMEQYEGYGIGDAIRCPVLEVVRGVYKEAKDIKDEDQAFSKELTACGRNHWVKLNYLMQGFANPIKGIVVGDDAPENPIRIFSMSKSVFQKLIDPAITNNTFGYMPTGEFGKDEITAFMGGDEEALMDGDEDLTVCREFIFRKTDKGEYSSYDTSNWSFNDGTFTDEQLDAIGEYGWHDLKNELTPQPSEEMLDLYVEIMQYSVDQELAHQDAEWQQKWTDAGIKPYDPKAKRSGNDDESAQKDAVKEAVSKHTRATATTTEATATVDQDDEDLKKVESTKPAPRKRVAKKRASRAESKASSEKAQSKAKSTVNDIKARRAKHAAA